MFNFVEVFINPLNSLILKKQKHKIEFFMDIIL